MTQTAKQKRRKKITAAVAMLLILCLLGGTFAWNNYRQHKTGDASLGGMFYKATLVEEFDRIAAKDWKTDATLTKKISVLNPGNSESKGDKKEYGDIYARIQLKEFMEFHSLAQQYSTERYMIDADGRFIRFFPGKAYEITVGEDGWPAAAEVTEPGPDAVVFSGEAAAKEYARLVGNKADNGAHEVERVRMFFTPFKTAEVARNIASINKWLARYNELNGTGLTVNDLTVDGAGVTLNVKNKILPVGMVNPDKGLDDDELPWYVKTKESDPNGVYGNFMVIDGQLDGTGAHNLLLDENGDGTADYLNTEIPQRADEDQKKSPDGLHDEWIDSAVDIGYTLDPVNGECEYTVHRWVDGMDKWNVNGPGKQSFFDYVKWTFGNDVILLSQWDGEPCAKWIIDDRPAGNDDGWVWWGSALAPGEQTGDLLEALTLLAQPSDKAYYALHADMQAVSYDELYRWEEKNDASGNDAIVEALRKSSLRVLSVAINEKPEDVGRGTSYSFSETLKGSAGVSRDVVWSLEGYSGTLSSISQEGRLTVGIDETVTALTVRVTSVFDPSKYSEWTVKVVTKPVVSGLTITPSTANLSVMGTTAFTAAETFVTGAAQTAGVTWSLENIPGSKLDVKKGNITITPDAKNNLKATVKASAEEEANIGETFKVIVTAKDPDKDSKYKTAEAVVTVQKSVPNSADDGSVDGANNIIPGTKLDDNSDWMPVAKSGDYYLIVRMNILPIAAMRFMNSGNSNYSYSNIKAQIEAWYNGTTTGTLQGLKSYAVRSNADSTQGSYDTISANISAPNATTGYAYPFALSYQEASYFICLKSRCPLRQYATSNWQALSNKADGGSYISWLRSRGMTTGVATILGTGGAAESNTNVNQAYFLRPAMWVKADIFTD